jgi:hypothetical protein
MKKFGPPPHNTNALKHGFYSKRFARLESADLARIGESPDKLEAEIALNRVMLARLFTILDAGPLAHETTSLMSSDALQHLAMLYTGLARLTHLIRLYQIDAGNYPPVETAILDALHELNLEDGLE